MKNFVPQSKVQLLFETPAKFPKILSSSSQKKIVSCSKAEKIPLRIRLFFTSKYRYKYKLPIIINFRELYWPPVVKNEDV